MDFVTYLIYFTLYREQLMWKSDSPGLLQLLPVLLPLQQCKLLSIFPTISSLIAIHASAESSKCTTAEQVLLKAVSSTSREIYFILKRQQKFVLLHIIKRHIAKPIDNSLRKIFFFSEDLRSLGL